MPSRSAEARNEQKEHFEQVQKEQCVSLSDWSQKCVQSRVALPLSIAWHARAAAMCLMLRAHSTGCALPLCGARAILISVRFRSIYNNIVEY